jgi:hypothetical protein
MVPIERRPRICAGQLCEADCFLMVKAVGPDTSVLMSKFIDEWKHEGLVLRSDSRCTGDKTYYSIACASPGACAIVRKRAGMRAPVSRLKSRIWVATPDIINAWFDEDDEEVVCFIDGWSGMGYLRTTCAVKLSSASSTFFRSAVPGVTNTEAHTVMEWRGDESLCRQLLQLAGQAMNGCVKIKYLIVDGKTAIYVLNIPGGNAKHSFIFNNEFINRSTWTAVINVPYIDMEAPVGSEWALKFRAGDISSDVPRFLAQSIVVPPVYHMFQHILEFAFETFAYKALKLPESTKLLPLLDAMNIDPYEHRFHGRAFNSGEARMATSWAEVTLPENGVEGVAMELVMKWLILMVLLDELQQILYCRWNRSEAALLRVHVVTRLLTELIARLDPSRIRNVYWANLYIAFPVFVERYIIPLFLILEEKFEQEFLSRKRHFAAKGGQPDFQEMFMRQHLKRRVGRRSTKFRSASFTFRYSAFRDIWLKKELSSPRWLSGIMLGRYRDLISEQVLDGVTYIVFATAGLNSNVTILDADYGTAHPLANIIKVDV